MPEQIHRFWYESALFFMEQEVKAAHSEQRVVDAKSLNDWSKYIRMTHASRPQRLKLVEGLELILEMIPSDEHTLIVKTSIKALQCDLRRSCRRIRRQTQ